jgi:hypothetical protein
VHGTAADRSARWPGRSGGLSTRHFFYLAEGDQDDEPRVDRTHAFEPDSNLTSLDGTAVWKALVGQGKAFDVSTLTAKALLHNLDAKDYGRPLDELRDLF